MKTPKIKKYLHRLFALGMAIFLVGVVMAVAGVGQAHAQAPLTPAPTPQPIADGLFLWQVNPLTITGNSNPAAGFVQGVMNVSKFSTPGGFLSALFPYIFVFAGIIFFFMLVWAGAHMVVGSIDDPKALEVGRNRVGASILGLVLLFMTYWIAQLVEAVFGVSFLG